MPDGTRRVLGPAHVLAVALISMAMVGWRVLGADPLTAAAEARLLDLRFQLRGARPPPPEALILALDEATLASAPDLSARRELLARALSRVADAEPAVVALDLLLVEQSDADGRLAAALARTPRVVLGVAALDTSARPPPLAPEQEAAVSRSLIPIVRAAPSAELPLAATVLLPRPAFSEAGVLGHVNILRASDRMAREVPLAIGLGEGRWLPALPLVAAAFWRGGGPEAIALDTAHGVSFGGGATVPTDRAGRIGIDHLGGAGTIETVSLRDVASGAIAPDRLADRMIFVGSTAPSLRDTFATPFGADLAGVEVMATAAANLVSGHTIKRDAGAALGTAALALATALSAMVAASLRRRWLASLSLLAVASLAAAALQAGFVFGRLWLDAVAVIAALGVGATTGGFLRFRAEQTRSDVLSRERRNLARYVSPALAEALASAPMPAFDRRRQNAAVLFVDVAGYTALVEDTDPVEVASFLRRLHSFFETAAEGNGGVVVDFLGDGAMIVFGLPDPAPDDAARALACADTLTAPPEGIGPAGAPVALRVSVHHGPIAVAILGGRRQGQVSITGDTVNLASRLQESAKAARAAFVTTGETLLAAGLDPEHPTGFEFLAADPTRGRKQSVRIYGRVLGGRGGGPGNATALPSDFGRT